MSVDQVAGEGEHAHAGDDAGRERQGVRAHRVVHAVERQRRGISGERQRDAQTGRDADCISAIPDFSCGHGALPQQPHDYVRLPRTRMDGRENRSDGKDEEYGFRAKGTQSNGWWFVSSAYSVAICDDYPRIRRYFQARSVNGDAARANRAPWLANPILGNKILERDAA